jgi:lipoyl(octanoyl) transferase
MKARDLGLMNFADAYALQEQLAEDLFKGLETETLLLLEHPPVYTIGRGGSEKNILDNAVEPVRINRGGDVTYHGPGQLIGYPIIDLGIRGRDLHSYLRFLEDLLISIAGDFHVQAYRVSGRTGVWTVRGKLASIGVGVRRWITMHGFALNVSTDLSRFSAINPCGIEACPVTSLEELSGVSVPMEEVKASVRRHFDPLLQQCLPVFAAEVENRREDRQNRI